MCLFVMRAIGKSAESLLRFERFRDGHCDCDTVLGKDLFSEPKDLKTAALRKKGWSDAKIKRAQEDRRKDRWNHRNADGTTYEQDLAYWVKTIPEKVGESGWLGLLLHWGDATDSFPFSRKQNVSLKDVSPAFLCSMQRDVLYVFTS